MPTRRAAVPPSPAASVPDDPPPLADVFLSDSRRDAELAVRLAATLRQEGFEVWFDQAIRAGDQWEQTLRGVLASAKAVLVLWSRHSMASPGVQLESDVQRGDRWTADPKLPAAFQPHDARYRGTGQGRLAIAAFWLDQAALLARPPAANVTPALWRNELSALAERTGLWFDPPLLDSRPL